MFARASSTLAPWEWHPGNSGQLTDTPSSCSSSVTWNFRFTTQAYPLPTKASIRPARAYALRERRIRGQRSEVRSQIVGGSLARRQKSEPDWHRTRFRLRRAYSSERDARANRSYSKMLSTSVHAEWIRQQARWSACWSETRNQRSEIRNSCSARAPSRTREARMLPHSIGQP